MPDPTRKPQAPAGWLSYAGFALAIAGIIYQGGVLSSTVQQNANRIAVLEASDKARGIAIETMNLRGERSAAKLDFLVEQARIREERR